jgi:hypothetical protein
MIRAIMPAVSEPELLSILTQMCECRPGYDDPEVAWQNRTTAAFRNLADWLRGLLGEGKP